MFDIHVEIQSLPATFKSGTKALDMERKPTEKSSIVKAQSSKASEGRRNPFEFFTYHSTVQYCTLEYRNGADWENNTFLFFLDGSAVSNRLTYRKATF